MATSISRLNAQIAKLQKQADDLRQSAVKRVQREIELHGLTAEDIFGTGGTVGNGRKTTSAKKTKLKSASAPRAAKFGDNAGNTWGGMGMRPQWLKAALDGGATLDSFLLSTQPTKSPKHEAASAAKPKVARKAAAKGARERKTVAKKVAAMPAVKAKAKAKPAANASVKRKVKPKRVAAEKPAESAAE